jgi:hypothetical protein
VRIDIKYLYPNLTEKLYFFPPLSERKIHLKFFCFRSFIKTNDKIRNTGFGNGIGIESPSQNFTNKHFRAFLQQAINGGLVMVAFYPHFVSCSEKATIKDVVGK